MTEEPEPRYRLAHAWIAGRLEQVWMTEAEFYDPNAYLEIPTEPQDGTEP
jgi:hypothetical protein